MRKRLWVAVTAAVVAALIACAKKAADISSVQPSPPSSAPAAPEESQAVPSPVAQSFAMARQVAKEVAGDFAGFNTEAYDHIEDNRFHRVDADPLSTFSIDVDTASYANVRRFLADGGLPPAGAVRTEELVNYFRFAYPQPSGADPFGIHKVIWDEILLEEFTFPEGKDRVLVSYDAGEEKIAYIETVGVGDALPDMPLILTNDLHVKVPLEATYQTAWQLSPESYRHAIETGQIPDPGAD